MAAVAGHALVVFFSCLLFMQFAATTTEITTSVPETTTQTTTTTQSTTTMTTPATTTIATTTAATTAATTTIAATTATTTMVPTTAATTVGATTSVSATTPLPGTPQGPTISPAGGTFSRNVSVTLSAGVSSTIWYTLNGNNPTNSSTNYSEPFTLGLGLTTVKAVAIENGVSSDTTSATFVVTDPSTKRCGDGARDSSEECDDGNTVSGDGCSWACNVEANWRCTIASPDTCVCNPNFYGPACSVVCSRSDTCSSRGSCSSLGTCVCDTDYFGTDCSTYAVPASTASVFVTASTGATIEASLSPPSSSSSRTLLQTSVFHASVTIPPGCAPSDNTFFIRVYNNSVFSNPPSYSDDGERRLLSGPVVLLGPDTVFLCDVTVIVASTPTTLLHDPTYRMLRYNTTLHTWAATDPSSLVSGSSSRVQLTTRTFAGYVSPAAEENLDQGFNMELLIVIIVSCVFVLFLIILLTASIIVRSSRTELYTESEEVWPRAGLIMVDGGDKDTVRRGSPNVTWQESPITRVPVPSTVGGTQPRVLDFG